MKWFIPSWNGDVRVESDPDDTERSIIVVHAPTAAELIALDALSKALRKEGWIEEPLPTARDAYRSGKVRHVVGAPLEKVAPLAVKLLKGGKQTLSAVVLKDGKVETVEGTDMIDLAALAKKGGEAGASVKRLTPCCPECHEGAVGPATEALLAFVSEEQHAQWVEHRYLVAVGHLSGHRYLLAHRHSERAKQNGKICFDLDDGQVVHFHDMAVPPEEEVLAAKLILEYREPWLRNEATLFGDFLKFKNPFGGYLDGTEDASMTAEFGKELRRALGEEDETYFSSKRTGQSTLSGR